MTFRMLIANQLELYDTRLFLLVKQQNRMIVNNLTSRANNIVMYIYCSYRYISGNINLLRI
jgi:hypothetical protein